MPRSTSLTRPDYWIYLVLPTQECTKSSLLAHLAASVSTLEMPIAASMPLLNATFQHHLMALSHRYELRIRHGKRSIYSGCTAGNDAFFMMPIQVAILRLKRLRLS